MLKRGSLDGPFAVRPEEGPLKSLPSYMVSKYILGYLRLEVETRIQKYYIRQPCDCKINYGKCN